ncbi:MAG: orotidine-5'-phosphate decarboxylase [archaeon]|nr:orotidine-5'-phosphate decarboxylase [archaeon]
MKIENKIILALDLMNLEDSIKLCEQISDKLNTIKIGYPLTLAEGLNAVTTLKKEFDFNIICDFKVADIDATNSKICDVTFESGADAIICHGFVGPDSVQACLDSANNHNKELFLLTEMSHPGARKFLQANADEIARMGREMGIKNYVAPATRINRLKEIREIVGSEACIISPGVGKQGGNVRKILNISNGAIIGRSIYEAEDPKKALNDFIDLIY